LRAVKGEKDAMKVSELVKKTGLKTFNEGADKEIMGVYISDMVSDIIGIKEGHLLITLQTHKNLIAVANLVDVAAVVLSRNKIPADDVVALANKAGIKLLGYDGDTWSLAKKLCELKIG
jgi:serine kinase of HPr protein (carbohydrate metabolism regulator)